MSFPNTVQSLVETGVFMSLGARNFRTDPEAKSLIFDATILPFLKDGKRGERGRTMAVQVGLDGVGLSLSVLYEDRGTIKTHCPKMGVEVDDLNRTLLALDYDGAEVFNPQYVEA